MADMEVAAAVRESDFHISPEIIEEILCYLPVKSLLRFRCVSKSWRFIISDPKFISRHLRRATLLDTLSHKKLIMNHYYKKFHLERAFSCPLSAVLNQPIQETNNIICPFLEDTDCQRLELKAFCDELWCVGINKSLFLWNPSTRSYRILPYQPVQPCPQPVHVCFIQAVYGVGYDSIGDDYKLLRILCLHDGRRESDLYSLRSNSWKKIQPLRGYIRYDREVKFVNGSLHLMVDRTDPIQSSVIISFNLSTEKYGKFGQPQYSPSPKSSDDVNVAVLREMLSVFYISADFSFVLWVMKNYGVEESWTRIFNIDCCNISPVLRRELLLGSRVKLAPMCLFENGDVLIWVFACDECEIRLYKNDEIRANKICADGHGKIRDCFIYVESLISPAMWRGLTGRSGAPMGSGYARMTFRETGSPHSE